MKSSAAPATRFTSPVRTALAETIALLADLAERIRKAEEPNPRLQELRDRTATAEAALATVQERERAEVRRFVEHGGVAPSPATEALRVAQTKLDGERRLLAAAEAADAERVTHRDHLAMLQTEAQTRRRALVADVLYHEAAPVVLRRLQAAIVAANRANASARALAFLLVEQFPGVPVLASNAHSLPAYIQMPDFAAHPETETALIDLSGVHAAARASLLAFVEGLSTNADTRLADNAE
ncbi:MAG TPA: hypothetical protein VKR31_16495 [Rhizomicrobium sp.]|nr:hypothetical protein [Rhizomicrobium sp.]